MLHFITALRCEAEPLIRHYGMKPTRNHGQIPLFCGDSAQLAISGVGSLQSAIATTTLFAQSPEPGPWLNVGIAGHRSADIGDLLIANKLSSRDAKKDFFPQLPLKTDIRGSHLITSNFPCFDYSEDAAFDMEGYGFYKAALHFSTLNGTHCLKVISDNPDSPATKFDKTWISELIEKRLPEITDFARQLEAAVTPPQAPRNTEHYLTHFHFTETQKHQLTKRLQQLAALDTSSPTDLSQFKNSKELLAHLQNLVDESAFQQIG